MKKTFIVPASINQLEQIQGYVEEILEAQECPLKLIISINIAVEEIFVNIANYAYDNNSGDIQVNIDMDEINRKLSISFIDSGIPFNPLEKEDADITLSAEERKIGGLGILMVKKSMDNVIYFYENGQNILTIEKMF